MSSKRFDMTCFSLKILPIQSNEKIRPLREEHTHTQLMLSLFLLAMRRIEIHLCPSMPCRVRVSFNRLALSKSSNAAENLDLWTCFYPNLQLLLCDIVLTLCDIEHEDYVIMSRCCLTLHLRHESIQKLNSILTTSH